MKPSIRKQDGRWWVSRPGYGFRPEPTVEDFGSWRAAVASLRTAPAAAGASCERGTRTLGLTGRFGMSAYRGTIRMEDR